MTSIGLLADRASTCTACPLSATRTQVVFGVGDPGAALVIIGEAPGAREDAEGRPFVGRSGSLLDQVLAEVGVSRQSVYITNVVKCRPPDNRNPTKSEIASCRPHLEDQLGALGARVIVTLGNFATQTVLDTREGITRLRGKTYAWGDRLVVPTYHPAAALRQGAAVRAALRSDLAGAVSLIRESV